MNPLSSIFSSPMMRITNKTNGIDVLIPIRTLKTSLKFSSKTAKHMMEDGSSKVDQRILMPVGVDIEMIAPSQDVLLQVNETLLDRSSTYTVQSRGIILDNMRVDYEGIDQNPKNISSTPLKLSFMEMMYQGSNAVAFANAADSSVIDRGMSVIAKAVDSVNSISEKVKNVTSIF